jgi:hypothetical protein
LNGEINLKMKTKKSNKVKIEIPSFEEKEKPKKKVEKKTAKVKPKVEPKLNKMDFIEIQGENLYLKIPDDLDLVVRVKKILEVYEDELYLERFKEKKKISEELEEPEELEEIEKSEELEIPTPTITQEKTPEILEEQKVVYVKPDEEVYTSCPICSGKLKKKRIKIDGNLLKQKVVCKNRKCNFERNYEFSI